MSKDTETAEDAVLKRIAAEFVSEQHEFSDHRVGRGAIKRAAINVKNAVSRKITLFGFLKRREASITLGEMLDTVPLLTDKSMNTLKALAFKAKDADNLELLVDYAIKKMPGGEKFAAEMIEHYLQSTPLDNAKLDRCLMLAAKMGNETLYDNIVDKGGAVKREDTISANTSGKSVLHYACQSENPKLVKKIAKSMGGENPFAISDKQFVNQLRPIHYMSPGLAEGLDREYDLDGNKKGSFSSAVGYYRRIHKVLSQGVLGFIKDKLSSSHTLAEKAAIAGKYATGLGVAHFEDEILKMGVITQHIAIDTLAAICMSSVTAATLYVKHLLSKKRAKEDNYSPVLNLDAAKQYTEQSITNESSSLRKEYHPAPQDAKEARYNVIRALKRHDLADIISRVDNQHFVADKQIIEALGKIVYFAKDTDKQALYKAIIAKAEHGQIEPALVMLANRGKKDLELAKTILGELVDASGLLSATPDLERLKKYALMAAQFGDIPTLDKAVAVLKPNGVKNLLDIKDKETGSNLMHYACSGGHVEMIRHLEPTMAQEFLLVPASEKKNGKVVAHNIFEFPNARGDQPKHYIGRETANQLDSGALIDARRGGFSMYAVRGFKDKQRMDKLAALTAMSAAGFMLSAAFAKAIPMALDAGILIASHGTSAIAHLVIPAFFEGTTTIIGAKLAHGLVFPKLNKFLRAGLARSKGYDAEIAGLKDTQRFTKAFVEKLKKNSAKFANTTDHDAKQALIEVMKEAYESIVGKQGAAQLAAGGKMMESLIESVLAVPGATPLAFVKSVMESEVRARYADLSKEKELIDEAKGKFVDALKKPRRFREAAKLTKEAQDFKETIEGVIEHHKRALPEAVQAALTHSNGVAILTREQQTQYKEKLEYIQSLQGTVKEIDIFVAKASSDLLNAKAELTNHLQQKFAKDPNVDKKRAQEKAELARIGTATKFEQLPLAKEHYTIEMVLRDLPAHNVVGGVRGPSEIRAGGAAHERNR